MCSTCLAFLHMLLYIDDCEHRSIPWFLKLKPFILFENNVSFKIKLTNSRIREERRLVSAMFICRSEDAHGISPEQQLTTS